MKEKKIDHILNSVKTSLNHPLFFARIYALVAKQMQAERNEVDTLLMSISEEYEELSRRLDRSQIQESCSVRNVLRTRQLAKGLINEKGELRVDTIPSLIEHLRENLFSLGPFRHYDAQRQEHILKVLQHLHSNKEIVRLLKKISKPISNKWAEELIKQTLQLPPTTSITDAHARQAALAAWLCYLRQNVGSCFATAPAEIIHQEQPENFLKDVLDLISTGSLKRTFGGIENSVPLSSSWGSGDLKKPLVIRSTSKGITPEIWHSPGLIAAFEAIGFLNPDDSTKLKVQQIEGWIKPLIHRGHASTTIITAEEIIRKTILQNLGITEKQIKEYESRPKGMIQTQTILQPSKLSKSNGGIGERCKNFIYSFELAKNTFKALADNALLKAWEFSLASFSDIKYEFARWNFYASLGLGTQEAGGIGHCIYQTIQHKLDAANRKVQEIQAEYEMVYTQVKTLESRIRHASTEKEAQWLKIDYQSRTNEFYFLEEQRDEAQKQASSLVDLYGTLYKIYVDLFQDYFQEVYDADMQEVTTGPFDDSPAGFRLLYKHGRSNTSQWTLIRNQQDFIDALASFFVATEPHIAHLLHEKKIEKDLSDVITDIINHIKTNEFLESAFHRMAIAHKAPLIKNPLENLEKIEKRPWVYTSGGTMNTLVSCYYRIEDKPKEVEKWVESDTELLVYIADTLKQIPPKFLNPFTEKKRYYMLMQSPKHAFLLTPMAFPFSETWSSEAYTYTSIRDRFIHPAEMFIESLLLNDEMLQFLVDQLSEKIPENYLPRFKALCRAIYGPLSPYLFRDYLVEMLEQDRGLRYGSQALLSSDEIDSFLYSQLPLFPLSELKERLNHLLLQLPELTTEKVNLIMQLYDRFSLARSEHSYLSAQNLQEICKALLCLSEVKTSSALDFHYLVSLAAQKLGYAMPGPIIFADTNWVKDMFGFVVNPGTGKFELWRTDYIGSSGFPMSSWKQWLDGSRSDLKWGIYVKPFQYGQN